MKNKYQTKEEAERAQRYNNIEGQMRAIGRTARINENDPNHENCLINQGELIELKRKELLELPNFRHYELEEVKNMPQRQGKKERGRIIEKYNNRRDEVYQELLEAACNGDDMIETGKTYNGLYCQKLTKDKYKLLRRQARLDLRNQNIR